MLSFCVGVGVHSPFRVQPNYSVEVVLLLCCVVVGDVTINTTIKRGDTTNKPREQAGSCQILNVTQNSRQS